MDEKNPEISPAPAPESAGSAAAAPEAAPAPTQPTAGADASNPFTAHRAAAPTPAPAPVPEPVRPYAQVAPDLATSATAAPAPARSAYEQAYGAPSQPAGAPVQPYAAAPAQPYAAALQQPYGAVPPTPPVPPAPVYGYEPPAPAGGQKRRWPWFLLGLAVGLVIGLGGCVGCAGIMAAATYDDYAVQSSPYQDYDRYRLPDDGYGQRGEEVPAVPSMPGTPDSSAAVGTYTADEIAKTLFPDDVPTDAPAEGAVCKAGVYEVGAAGQIPAGLYFMQGAEDAECNYYLFEAADDAPGRYEVDDSVVYFGNYFAQLDEGDLIVFKPAGDQTMYPAPATSINPAAPYNDGCYRVGIDIPAGTYTITPYGPSAAATAKECAAYVMKDLDFDDDSITESVYVITGGTQTVTVADGQYLELFATTATPVDPAAPADPADPADPGAPVDPAPQN